jgi:hypothetical protein
MNYCYGPVTCVYNYVQQLSTVQSKPGVHGFWLLIDRAPHSTYWPPQVSNMQALMATLSRMKSSEVELPNTNARETNVVSGRLAHGIFSDQDVGVDEANGDAGATLAFWNTVAGSGAASVLGFAIVKYNLPPSSTERVAL